MTNAFIAEFDLIAHQAFAAAGIADGGTFQSAANGVSLACKVMVNFDPVVAALAGVEIIKDQAMVRLLFDGMTVEPRIGDVIVVAGAVGDQRFEVARRVRTDPDGSWVLVCAA